MYCARNSNFRWRSHGQHPSLLTICTCFHPSPLWRATPVLRRVPGTCAPAAHSRQHGQGRRKFVGSADPPHCRAQGRIGQVRGREDVLSAVAQVRGARRQAWQQQRRRHTSAQQSERRRTCCWTILNQSLVAIQACHAIHSADSSAVRFTLFQSITLLLLLLLAAASVSSAERQRCLLLQLQRCVGCPQIRCPHHEGAWASGPGLCLLLLLLLLLCGWCGCCCSAAPEAAAAASPGWFCHCQSHCWASDPSYRCSELVVWRQPGSAPCRSTGAARAGIANAVAAATTTAAAAVMQMAVESMLCPLRSCDHGQQQLQRRSRHSRHRRVAAAGVGCGCAGRCAGRAMLYLLLLLLLLLQPG